MEQALDKADMKEAAAVAHKMIPLFVLLEAYRLVAVLRELEAAADAPFSAEWEEKIRTILTKCWKTFLPEKTFVELIGNKPTFLAGICLLCS